MVSNPRTWSFTIDRYINPFIPPPPWHLIPSPIARFLGHRPPGYKPAEVGNLQPIFWAFIGIFCGVALIEGVNMSVPSFQARDAPLIVGSFGAAAVLEFYAIDSPLAQPRNAIFGQLISAFTGVAVCKLFLLGDFDHLRWLGGATACAAATALMALTKTVHPPAGATALLAVTDPTIVNLGWFYLLVILLGCMLMLAVAMLINNIGRRFPLYWWTPEDVGRKRPGQHPMFERRASSIKNQHRAPHDSESERGDVEADAGLPGGEESPDLEQSEVIIRPGQVIVPEHMYLTQEEKTLLEIMSQRL